MQTGYLPCFKYVFLKHEVTYVFIYLNIQWSFRRLNNLFCLTLDIINNHFYLHTEKPCR